MLQHLNLGKQACAESNQKVIEELKGHAVKQAKTADVLVVGGSWEASLVSSTASLIARLYGRRLCHEGCLQAPADSKALHNSIAFAPLRSTPRIHVSAKAQEKHRHLWDVIVQASKDFPPFSFLGFQPSLVVMHVRMLYVFLCSFLHQGWES